MGSAEFNIPVREMLNLLAKVLGGKNKLNSANIYSSALYEQEMRSYRNNNVLDVLEEGLGNEVTICIFFPWNFFLLLGETLIFIHVLREFQL